MSKTFDVAFFIIFSPLPKKIKKNNCISKKDLLPLQMQSFMLGRASEIVSNRNFADILYRRLSTLCSDVFETSQLSKLSSDLATLDVLRGCCNIPIETLLYCVSEVV